MSLKDLEKRKQYMKEYYKKNRDKIIASQLGYRKDNKPKTKERLRKYYIENKDKINQYKQDNINKLRKYRKEYYGNKYNNDIQYKIRTRLCCRFNNAIRRYKINGVFPTSRNKNINYGAIIEQLKPFPENVGDYEIDHIIPLDFFDLNDEEQLRKAWDPINFQWLKCSNNESKGKRIDFSKYPEQEAIFSKLKL